MKWLRFILFAAIGLFLLASVLLLCLQPKVVPAKSLVLPGGLEWRIAGATYGTNHVMAPLLARLAARLPQAARTLVTRIVGPQATPYTGMLSTANPTLAVWLESESKTPLPAEPLKGFGPPFGALSPGGQRIRPGAGRIWAFLSDAGGFLSGDGLTPSSITRSGGRRGPFRASAPLFFSEFPRRDRVIWIHFFYDDPDRGATYCGRLPFRNPLHGRFPEWRPEPVPAVKKAGDVLVTLSEFSSGYPVNPTPFPPPRDLRPSKGPATNAVEVRNGCRMSLSFQPIINTNQAWRLSRVELDDATGNQAVANGMGFVGLPGAAYNTFSPGLWPSEAAWKLRCEIALTAGFAPGETFTFKNAPMGGPESTNRLGWSTNREGLSVTLDGFSFPGRRQGHLPSGAPSFQTLQADLSVRGLPSGENLDLVEAYADSTNRVQGFMSRRDNHWTCTFHLFRVQAHNLDMTFAIHRSRWVEFMVNPAAACVPPDLQPVRER